MVIIVSGTVLSKLLRCWLCKFGSIDLGHLILVILHVLVLTTIDTITLFNGTHFYSNMSSLLRHPTRLTNSVLLVSIIIGHEVLELPEVLLEADLLECLIDILLSDFLPP